MGAILKFLRLDTAQRALVLRAFGAVLRSSTQIHVLPTSNLTRRLKRQHWTVNSASGYSVEQTAWSVAAVAKHVPGSSCLVQALALARLMHANGYRCQLDIGVMKSQDGKFAAHAWVRYEGRVILGGDTREYKLIASFP